MTSRDRCAERTALLTQSYLVNEDIELPTAVTNVLLVPRRFEECKVVLRVTDDGLGLIMKFIPYQSNYAGLRMIRYSEYE